MRKHPLQNLVYETNRIVYYPGKLLNQVCQRLVENDLDKFRKYLSDSTSESIPDFLNVNANFFLNSTRETAVNWFQQLQKIVNREYDKYCLQIKEATILALACFEAYEKQERDKIGLMIMLSMSHLRQNKSEKNCSDFAKRFAKAVREIDLATIDMEKSFLYKELMYAFDKKKARELFDHLCNGLEVFTTFTIRSWNVAMQYSSFLTGNVFQPIIETWQETVIDLEGTLKQDQRSPPLTSLQKKIAENMTDASIFYGQESDTFLETDLTTTIQAIVDLQTDIPSNLNELNDIFKRRTGYDILVYVALLNAEVAEESRVELVEARPIEVINDEKSKAQKEYDNWKKTLTQLETDLNLLYNPKYSLFKQAAQSHFRRNPNGWKDEMNKFDLDIRRKEDVLIALEQVFISKNELENLEAEKDGLLKSGKRTLKRIRQELEKAEFHSAAAGLALKKALVNSGVNIDDPRVVLFISLVMNKKLKITEDWADILRQQFPQQVSVFQAAKSYFEYALDAVDTVNYLRREEEERLKTKDNWKIFLTMLFFILWGALFYYLVPWALEFVSDSVVNFFSNPSNATAVANATDLANATVVDKNAFVQMVDDVQNTIEKIVAAPATIYTYVSSTLYKSGIKGTRLDDFLQNIGVVDFDFSRLSYQSVKSAFLKGQFTSAYVLGYYWLLVFKLGRTLIPFWHALAVASSRVVLEGYYEDDMLNSIGMEVTFLATNVKSSMDQFYDLGMTYIGFLWDRGQSGYSMGMSVLSMLRAGKAGIIPATLTMMNANAALPESFRLHLQNFSKQEHPKLWFEQATEEAQKQLKLDAATVATVSKVTPANKPIYKLAAPEKDILPDVDL